MNSITARHRRAFTLAELLVASVVASFVIGAVGMSLSQLGKAKTVAKERFDAYLRAHAALTAIRRDIASIIRTDDLFYSRFLLFDEDARISGEMFDRDEMLLFTNRLRAVRRDDYQGEGFEYETQYRIDADEYGPVLWQRRDAFPDEIPGGGGLATPLVEGVLSLDIEAYDGERWLPNWDSDYDGLPVAVRVTVTACGHQDQEDILSAPRATLRTAVAIDRLLVPKDIRVAEAEALAEELGLMSGVMMGAGDALAPGAGAGAGDVAIDGGFGGGGSDAAGGFTGGGNLGDDRPGGGRPGGGRPGGGSDTVVKPGPDRPGNNNSGGPVTGGGGG